ncbi:unnamed protein product [Closterium sp. NIES-54]
MGRVAARVVARRAASLVHRHVAGRDGAAREVAAAAVGAGGRLGVKVGGDASSTTVVATAVATATAAETAAAAAGGGRVGAACALGSRAACCDVIGARGPAHAAAAAAARSEFTSSAAVAGVPAVAAAATAARLSLPLASSFSPSGAALSSSRAAAISRLGATGLLTGGAWRHRPMARCVYGTTPAAAAAAATSATPSTAFGIPMHLRALSTFSAAPAASQAAAFTTSAVAAASEGVGTAAATTAAAAAAAAGNGAGGAKGRASAAASRSKTHWARLAGATLVGSTMTAGVLLSTQDPQTISKWSFAASDAVTPFLRLLDPEAAHRLALLSAELSLVPHEHRPDPPSLCIVLWNRAFPNPVGLAAGFDKDGRAVDGLLGMGFGFMEIGSVTPAPQPGNPKPRVWRIPEQKAVINRYGFNSEGIAAVAERLGAQQGRRRAVEKPEGLKTGKDRAVAPPAAGGSAGRRGLVGVNLGKNKWTDDAEEDFVQGMHTLAQYADFLVVNVSSPNTPGLRKLQGRRHLHGLLNKVLAAREEMQWGEEGPPPLLLKISPDLSQQDMADIAAVALSLKLDGLIVGNTTVSRPDSVLGLLHADEPGGLSGRPLFDPSTHTLREMYRLTKGRVTLIGCGGIFSGADAYAKIRAGASLVQIYTAMVYEGAGVLPRIKRELAECLARDGFESVEFAVGADHRAAALLHVHA